MTKSGTKRHIRWQYAIGGSIVGVCLLGAGIAAASSSNLDELSGGDGSYTYSCDTTISGAHGTVIISRGTTCIIDAQISGSVVVNKPGAVIVRDSSVTGSITESLSSGTQICGTTVGGSVSVAGATGFVLIGDPGNGCYANTVTGSIVVTNNHNGLVVVGNTVGGSVVSSGNSGSGPLAGQYSPIVSGNHH